MKVKFLGIQPYIPIWDKMKQFTDTRDENSEDELWVLQHPPIFTLGRHSDRSHIIKSSSIPIQEIDRGGQVTFHGPGQLIIYCLLDIRRLKLGVRETVTAIEKAVIAFLKKYNIKAHAKKNAPGVYTEEGKISALGLRVRKGKCFHGLSLNIAMNLEPFHYINPCGYTNLKVVQLSDYTEHVLMPQCGQELSDCLKKSLHEHL